MSNLLAIGRSGLMAAQARLQVSGENIANAETEGYHKRSVETREIGGGKMNPLSEGTTSQGVSVENIRRAFDAIVAERVRTTAGDVSENEAMLPVLNILEARVTPQDGGPLDMMDAFFAGISAVSGDPVDTGLRKLMLTSGESFVDGVKTLAVEMETMIESAMGDQANHIDEANKILKELGQLQQKTAQTQDSGALNPLMDRRDLLIKELNELIDITVTPEDGNLVRITFGNTTGGLPLIYRDEVAQLRQDGPNRVEIVPEDPDTPAQTRPLTGGALYGFSQSMSAIDAALTDLNLWAQKVASEMNAAHRDGVDLDGAPGEDMFSLVGWKVQALDLNRGTGQADVTMTDPTIMPDGPIELVRDTAASLWRALDANRDELASGDNQITLPGMIIGLSGKAVDGDRLILSRRTGHAADLNLIIKDPRKIAAAAAVSSSAHASNVGISEVYAEPGLNPLENVTAINIATNDNALEASEFLSPGVVGVIPSGTQSVTLATLDRQASLSFPATGGTLTSLSITIDGTTHDFTAPSALSEADFISQMNGGLIESATGLTLGETGGRLMLSGSEILLDVAGAETLVTADLDGTAATVLSDPEPAADMAIFTRDGLQVAGAPMDPSEAALYLTEANGFLPGATYRMADLNSPDAYRGMTQIQSNDEGNFVTQLGASTGLSTWTAADPVPVTPSVTLNLSAIDGGTVTVPEGTTATQIANMLREDVSATVTARNDLALDVTGDGTVSFRIKGENINPFQISADVIGGDLTKLAQSINLASSGTGITAELAPDGDRLVLTHASGADITITQFAHSGGGTMTADRVDSTGNSLGAGSATLGAGGDTALRATGTVKLASQLAFSVSEGASSLTAARDTFNGGRMARSIEDGGSTQVISVSYDASFDGAQDDGILQSAGSALYTMTIQDGNGAPFTATFDPQAYGAQDSVDAAYGMAAALREIAVGSRLTGEAVTGIPGEGTMMRVSLGEDIYSIRMENGVPVVSGPEEGRLTASFDASNRLVVETNGGALDGSVLQVASSPADAAAFGMGLTNVVQSEGVGGKVDLVNWPGGTQSATFTVDGSSYTLSASSTGTALSVSVGGGFAGSASWDATNGRIIITPPAGSGPVEFAPQSGADVLGFGNIAAKVSVSDDGKLSITATDSRVLDIAAQTQASGNRITLNDLPNEDLLVVMAGNGSQKMAVDIQARINPEPDREVELRVLDASSDLVGLYDAETGHEIARRTLGTNGDTLIGGYAVTLTAGYEDGDAFTLLPARADSGDSRILERLADLQMRNVDTGLGGFQAVFNEMVTSVGGVVSATTSRLETANSMHEAALRADAEKTSVDLDEEAANLLAQQQAYQANAQVMSVARSLFDTLLNSL